MQNSGINLDQEALATDIIDQVGIGNQYLTETHAFEHFRSENWMPSLFDRNRYYEWTESGQKDLA